MLRPDPQEKAYRASDCAVPAGIVADDTVHSRADTPSSNDSARIRVNSSRDVRPQTHGKLRCGCDLALLTPIVSSDRLQHHFCDFKSIESFVTAAGRLPAMPNAVDKFFKLRGQRISFGNRGFVDFNEPAEDICFQFLDIRSWLASKLQRRS